MNTNCTSACGNDYDCTHEYDEVTLKVQHDTGERKFEAEIVPTCVVYGCDTEATKDGDMLCVQHFDELTVDQEAKHGEERASNQD